MPRARLTGEDGKTREWRGGSLRAYQRRTRAADALIAGAYLAGTNTRRVRRSRPWCPQNARHALVADLVALRAHRVRNGPQRLSLCPQRDHFADRLLLGLMLDELAVVKWQSRDDASRLRGTLARPKSR